MQVTWNIRAAMVFCQTSPFGRFRSLRTASPILFRGMRVLGLSRMNQTGRGTGGDAAAASGRSGLGCRENPGMSDGESSPDLLSLPREFELRTRARSGVLVATANVISVM